MTHNLNDEIVLSINFFIHRQLIPRWKGQGDQMRRNACIAIIWGCRGRSQRVGEKSYSHTVIHLILSYLILLSYLIEDTGRVRAPMVIWASVINDRDDLPGGHNRVGFVKNCSLMKQFFSCAAPHPSPTLFAALASF